jgi:PilZ domain
MSYNLERRQSPRKRFEHLLYVELEPANGGMVLNFSEHGFGFRAVKRVRPKEEVRFALNLDEKRRLEGRGRLEWTDKEGRVAGLQFTDISEEFRAEIRNWLTTAKDYAAKSPKNFVPPGASPAVTETSPELIERSLSSRRREALGKAVAAKSVRSISSIPSNSSYPLVPDISAESFAAESSRADGPSGVPWASILPPAVGVERKPSAPSVRSPAAPSEFSAATAFKLAPVDPETAESPDVSEEAEQTEEFAAPAELARNVSPVSPAVPENPIAAVEARTAGTLNEHAQALLQHFQHEEQRMVAAFRESAARVLRDSERQLFPIREAVQAQMKNLESSVASAAASAKVLDQYPSLLERAQQQALDRFQTQVQEVLHLHVMELRRRSEALMEEINVRVRSTALLPRRIRTSSGIVVTGLIVMLLAVLFAFRREAAGAFIWMGEQMVEPATVSEPANVGNAGSAGNTSNTAAAPETKPKEEPLPTPTEALAAPKETPAVTPKDVRSLWNEVAKGNVSAEMTLGTMYFTGHGVTRNCYQARRLFSAAAKKGNDEARQKLAELDNGACS